MNQPLKSLSAPKLPSSKRESKRRVSADFAELVLLERAARRACFVPIPRAVARLIESNEAAADESAIELSNRHAVANGSLPWDKSGVRLAPVGEPGPGNRPADTRSVMLV